MKYLRYIIGPRTFMFIPTRVYNFADWNSSDKYFQLKDMVAARLITCLRGYCTVFLYTRFDCVV